MPTLSTPLTTLFSTLIPPITVAFAQVETSSPNIRAISLLEPSPLLPISTPDKSINSFQFHINSQFLNPLIFNNFLFKPFIAIQ